MTGNSPMRTMPARSILMAVNRLFSSLMVHYFSTIVAALVVALLLSNLVELASAVAVPLAAVA